MICQTLDEELHKPKAEKQFSDTNGVWGWSWSLEAENKTKQENPCHTAKTAEEKK